MKKSIILIAAAALLSMTACQKDDVNPVNNVATGNTEVTPTAKVKSTSDLHNTDWTATVDLSTLIASMINPNEGLCFDSIEGLNFETYLNFDGTYAHFTFSQEVEAWGLDANGEMQQITGVAYEYSYNGATHTGALVASEPNEDGTYDQLQFTYDDATDAITFILPLYTEFDTNAVNVPLVFNRAI